MYDRFYGVWRVELLSSSHAAHAAFFLTLGSVTVADQLIRITGNFFSARKCRRSDRPTSLHLFGIPARATSILVGLALKNAGLAASAWRIELNKDGKPMSRAVVVFPSVDAAAAATELKVRYTWHRFNTELTWAPLTTPLCFACRATGHLSSSCPRSNSVRAARQCRKAVRDALSAAPTNAVIVPTRSLAPSLVRTGLSFRDAVSASASRSVSASASSSHQSDFPALPDRPPAPPRPALSTSCAEPIASLRRKIDFLSSELASVKSSASDPSSSPPPRSVEQAVAAAIAPFHQQVAALAAQNAKLMEIVDGLRRDNELLRQLTQVTVSAAHEPSDDVSGNTRSTKRTKRVADAATSSSSPAGSPSLTQPQLEAIVRNTSHLIWSNQDKYHRSMTSNLESIRSIVKISPNTFHTMADPTVAQTMGDPPGPRTPAPAPTDVVVASACPSAPRPAPNPVPVDECPDAHPRFCFPTILCLLATF